MTRQRPAPRPAPRPRAAPAPPQPRPRRSIFSRLPGILGILLVIAILAAVIAGVVLLTTNAGQNTPTGIEIKHSIQDQVNSIRDFVNSHTQ